MSATPTVPSIAPVQQAAPIDTGQSIGDLLGPIAARAAAPLPDPYTQGVQVAEPHYHDKPPAQTDRPTNNVPITGQVADVKRARRQNAVAGLANTISQAGNMIQAKKQEKLKDQLTDVMKAKQNIANATQVGSDPNATDQQKQLAKKVLEANKKQLNTILSDPKTQKQMQKALDISFVDPEKNKTPEVKAYQDAMKEFKEAGPFNADNPGEHQIATIAATPNTPKQMGSQATMMNAPSAPQAAIAKSTTPYADAALTKDLPTISANPQYAAAVKQQQDAQKQLATIVPKLIEAESKRTIQAARDGNASAKAQFEGSLKLFQQSNAIVARSKLADSNNKAAMARVGANNAARMKETEARINAALKIADNKNLSKEQSEKIKSQSLETLDKEIATATKTLNGSEDALAKAKADKADSGLIESLNVQRDLAVISISTLQKLRSEKFTDAPSVQAQGLLDGNSSGSGSKDIKVQSVGDSDSDEPEDDDSDKY